MDKPKRNFGPIAQEERDAALERLVVNEVYRFRDEQFKRAQAEWFYMNVGR